MRATVGAQGIGVRDVAYLMGLRCPKGQEIILALGLRGIWPQLPASEACDAFWAGLAARYKTDNRPAGGKGEGE